MAFFLLPVLHASVTSHYFPSAYSSTTRAHVIQYVSAFWNAKPSKLPHPYLLHCLFGMPFSILSQIGSIREVDEIFLLQIGAHFTHILIIRNRLLLMREGARSVSVFHIFEPSNWELQTASTFDEAEHRRLTYYVPLMTC